jgi:hypothetical protein
MKKKVRLEMRGSEIAVCEQPWWSFLIPFPVWKTVGYMSNERNRLDRELVKEAERIEDLLGKRRDLTRELKVAQDDAKSYTFTDGASDPYMEDVRYLDKIRGKTQPPDQSSWRRVINPSILKKYNVGDDKAPLPPPPKNPKQGDSVPLKNRSKDDTVDQSVTFDSSNPEDVAHYRNRQQQQQQKNKGKGKQNN